MVGLGSGEDGVLDVPYIASETANLRRVICNKKRAPDAGATATTSYYVVL
jgi:hypothetical protein